MDENKKRGILATVLVHLALLLIFMFTGLTIPLPFPPDEIGLPVELALGNTDEGSGELRPTSPAPMEITDPESEPEPTTDATPEEIATQEESDIAAPTQPEKKPEPKKPELDSRLKDALNNPFQAPTKTDGEGQGNTDNAGTFGNPDGSPTGNSLMGGSGGGRVEGLGGRNAKNLKKLPGNWQESGTIKVDVVVDRTGKVVRASIARGTTITNAALLRVAETEARRVEFTPKADAPEEQRGQIIYEIILQ